MEEQLEKNNLTTEDETIGNKPFSKKKNNLKKII